MTDKKDKVLKPGAPRRVYNSEFPRSPFGNPVILGFEWTGRTVAIFADEHLVREYPQILDDMIQAIQEMKEKVTH